MSLSLGMKGTVSIQAAKGSATPATRAATTQARSIAQQHHQAQQTQEAQVRELC